MSIETESTPAPNRRATNVEARRKRILEAARHLLAENGHDGLSMRKLAAEASLSVTTLYNLVGSREEILQALVEDSTERLEEEAPAPEPAADPLRRIVADFEHALDWVVENASLLRPLIVAEFATGSWTAVAKADRESRHFKQLKSNVHEALKEAAASGWLREAVSRQFVESQMYVGFELALDRWAAGALNDKELFEWTMCGVYTTFLAFVESRRRPPLEKELGKLERRLRRRSGRFISPRKIPRS